MKTNIIQRRSMIFALMGVFLMVSGVFVLIPTSPQGVSLNLSGQSGQGNQVSPDLASVSETASTSTAVSYYDSVLQSNSSVSTVTLPAAENSTQSNGTINSGIFASAAPDWKLSSNNTWTSITESIFNANRTSNKSEFWTDSNGYTVSLQDLAYMSQPISLSTDTTPSLYEAGSLVYANLTLTVGTTTFTIPWSTTAFGTNATTDQRVVFIFYPFKIYSFPC